VESASNDSGSRWHSLCLYNVLSHVLIHLIYL
jgi:hypothetical protein